MAEKMFPFVDATWNPYCMRCPHQCVYCWAEALKDGKLKDAMRYVVLRISGEKIGIYVMSEFKRHFKAGQCVFVEDMGDLFAEAVPDEVIGKVFAFIEAHADVTFLLMTKNPARYVQLWRKWVLMPKNVIYGTTIESNISYPEISKAPHWFKRLQAIRMMADLNQRVFIAIEPILHFHLTDFIRLLDTCRPWGVAVGYDNYNNHLPEPTLAKTNELIRELEKFTKVYRKTLRKAHWEA